MQNLTIAVSLVLLMIALCTVVARAVIARRRTQEKQLMRIHLSRISNRIPE